MILTGKEVAEKILYDLNYKAKLLLNKGIVPTLAIIKVGNNLSNVAYLKSIEKRCLRANIKFVVHDFAKEDEKEILNCIFNLNNNKDIHGILVFRPILNKNLEKKIIDVININKDVDAMKLYATSSKYMGKSCNRFSTCTAEAVIAMFDYYNINLKGKTIAVIGRSSVVGRPIADLLLMKGALVIVCHSKTKDIEHKLRSSDIIISAAGRCGLVTCDMVHSGQTIIDVSINASKFGGIVGDVDFKSVSKIVKNITPVPGGVGSVTSSILCSHVIFNAAANHIDSKNI